MIAVNHAGRMGVQICDLYANPNRNNSGNCVDLQLKAPGHTSSHAWWFPNTQAGFKGGNHVSWRQPLLAINHCVSLCLLYKHCLLLGAGSICKLRWQATSSKTQGGGKACTDARTTHRHTQSHPPYRFAGR